MSVYHSVKCTKDEARIFRDKVKSFLDAEKIPYEKLIALRAYDGEVRIYTGKTLLRKRRRPGLALVARKNPDGTYTGDEDAIDAMKWGGGDKIFRKTTGRIEEKEYVPMFRCDDWEEEKQMIREELGRSQRK